MKFRKKGTERWCGGKDFVDLNSEICAAFGAVPDPDEWFRDWYNCLVPGLGLGRTYEEMKEVWKDNKEMLEIIEWLEKHVEWKTYLQYEK